MKKVMGVLLLACASASPAFAQVAAPKCKILTDTTVPITTSGYWCLGGNVVGHGIVIDASDVVLDLRGYSIINDGTATTPMEFEGFVVGVLSQNDNNITVRNGIIRGFDFGVHLGFPAGVKGTLLVERLFVQGSHKRGISVLGYETVNILDNTITGTGPTDSVGIYANGRTDPYNNDVNLSVLTITGNRIHDTHVSAAGKYGWQPAIGIQAFEAASTIIESNVITDVYNDSTWRASGIEVVNRFPNTSRVAYNTIINTRAAPNTYGIFNSQSMGIPVYTGPMDYFGVVHGSRVHNFAGGVLASAMVKVDGKPVPVTVYSYSNNVVSAITGQAFQGGRLVPRTNRVE